MSVFTENIWIAPLPKTGKWITTKGFRFYIYEVWSGEYIDVPAWFEFDWCSVPICILWSKINPKTINPCCLHDRLYKKKLYWFHFSNRIFFKALRSNSISLFTGTKYLLGVSLFWWISYYNIIDRLWTSIRRRLHLSEKISDKIK